MAKGRFRRGRTVGAPTANFSLSLRVLGHFLDEKRAVTLYYFMVASFCERSIPNS